MKIGFYDSGLGGLSVLREFYAKYPDHEYIYWGDSARAPYGDKSPEQLKMFLKEALDYMQSKNAELVISACNTTSMFISEIDKSHYPFEVIDLHSVMKKYFSDNSFDETALLATSANIDKERYKEWTVAIQAIKCPKLVPLVEALDFEKAKEEWKIYLKEVKPGVENVIVGCTHYAFLVEKEQGFNFINPAKIALSYCEEILASNKETKSSSLDLYFTTNLEKNIKAANRLLGSSETSNISQC